MTKYYEYEYFKKSRRHALNAILSANREFSYRALSKLLLLPRINAVGAAHTKKFRVFSLNKKAHDVERRRVVSQDGALSPIFGGETSLQKIDP